MSWDPGTYLRFPDLRARPGLELLSRIDQDNPDLVVDLGCGPGNLTAVLAERWPDARLLGVDSSPAMMRAASTDHPTIEWVEADLREWEPPAPVTVLFSNAALHWVANHDSILPRLISWLLPGGTLAVQMPANWNQPTHTIPAAILDTGGWPQPAIDGLIRDRVDTPNSYRRILAPTCDRVDIWSTTYHQVLTGEDPVLAWVEGSVLAPVLDALEPDDRQRFRQACGAGYARAYPTEPDGTTVLPFTRLFIIARRAGG